MLVRIVYDSATVTDVDALRDALTGFGADVRLTDLRYLRGISVLCDSLDHEALNIVDASVSGETRAALVGYALGANAPLLVVADPSEDRRTDATPTIGFTTGDGLVHDLASLIGRLETHQVTANTVGLFASIGHDDPVAIVCAEIPEDLRPEYAKPGYRDFLRYATFADIDALIQLMVRFAASKHRAVHAYTSQGLPDDAFASHVLVIGGPAWNGITRSLYKQVDLPIRHPDGGDGHPDPFRETVTGRQWLPEFSDRVVHSDISLVAQLPSPYQPGRTVTLFDGILTHGVEGAVKAFTSPHVRTPNWSAIKPLREPPSTGFCLLFRTSVVSNVNLPPDLREDRTLLAAYSHIGGRFVRVDI